MHTTRRVRPITTLSSIFYNTAITSFSLLSECARHTNNITQYLPIGSRFSPARNICIMLSSSLLLYDFYCLEKIKFVLYLFDVVAIILSMICIRVMLSQLTRKINSFFELNNIRLKSRVYRIADQLCFH